MDKKIRVNNPNKFPVGITLINGLDMAIPAKSFTRLSRDEVEYISTTSSFFRRGILRVDEKELDVIEDLHIPDENAANFLSDDELRKKLSGTTKNLVAFIEPIEDIVLIDRIVSMAKEMDLAASKVKALEDKFGDLDI